ncbi:MAG: T9SS type A sorting domain-containing protein, partial [Candidatus Kapaibacterium sp.]
YTRSVMKATIYLLAFLVALSAVFPQVPVNHSVTSTKCNIELTVTNNGMVGHNPVTKKSGFIWPRGSNAQYLYGGGFILLQSQVLPFYSSLLPEYSYDFMDGSSWFVPGAISDGKLIDSSKASKYKVYSSINYDKYSGHDLSDDDAHRWPIWIDTDYFGAYYGDYKIEESERTLSLSKPFFKSDEDIVAIYKDTDTNVNVGNNLYELYMPHGVEAQTRVYSYDDENRRDVVFINWIITNKSKKKLDNLIFAPVFDIDITKTTNSFTGIDNDIIITPNDSSYISFATKMEEYEEGGNFGFISFKWVLNPIIADKMEYQKEFKLKKAIQIQPSVSPADTYIYNYFDDPLPTLSIGEQKFIMLTNYFALEANQSASFVIQINMTPPNKDYPNMDDVTRKKIEAELLANETFFKERLTSVEKAEEQSLFTVYPNPTKNGEISLKLDLPIGEQMTIELYDLSGNALATLYQGQHSNQQYELNLGKKAAGTYLLSITVGDKKYSKKFVVGE